MQDINLVQNIKENKNPDENLAILASKHSGLINKISYKYIKPLYDSGSSIEEIEQEKNYIIYKAAISFNENKKTKFSSYLGSYVRWYCLNKINRSDDWKFISETPLENIVDFPAEKIDSSSLDYVKSLINKIEDEKIKKVFELRFFSTKFLSWNDIGKQMGGITGQTVNNWYKKTIKLLKNRVAANHEI